MLKKDERKITLWERKILRRTFGTINENGYLRIKTNKDKWSTYNKSPRLRWLGHVERKEEGILLNTIIG